MVSFVASVLNAMAWVAAGLTVFCLAGAGAALIGIRISTTLALRARGRCASPVPSQSSAVPTLDDCARGAGPAHGCASSRRESRP